MLLPRWFPFHLDKVSYWARTVIVPLLVLQALKPRARNPTRRDDRRTVPRAARDASAPPAKAPHQKWAWFTALPRRRHGAARLPSRYFPQGRGAARDRSRRRLRHRAAQRRGRARRDLSGHGQQRDDVRRRSAIRRIIPTGRSRERSHREAAGDPRATRPTASPACRRSGTPRSPAMRCSRPATTRAVAERTQGARLAAARCRCST